MGVKKDSPLSVPGVLAQIEIQADSGRNLIRIRYFGHVTVAGVKARFEEMETLIRRMRAGFTMLTDLTALEGMELECASDISRIMELCKAGGVGQVIRIIPDPGKDIGFNILSLIHYRQGVRIMTCDTLAEAERLLD